MSEPTTKQEPSVPATTNVPAAPPADGSSTAMNTFSGDQQAFDLAQRKAIALPKSSIVPKDFQNNVSNCMIAMEMAHRMGASVMMVMQSLHVVHGNPGFNSKFLIATVNSSGRFSALRYEVRGTDPKASDYAVRAWATEKDTNQRLDGTWITWEMVRAEGWEQKTGSKWKTMPEQMFKYRAAAFWQRAYAPEISMGLQSAEEVDDITPAPPPPTMRSLTPSEMKTAISQLQNRAITIDIIKDSAPNLDPAQLAELKKHEPAD